MEQRTGVDLAGISSFHTLSLSKIYGAAQPAIEYICFYKPYPPPGENPDTQPSVSQTISDGSFCGGNAGSSQYIQSFKIHLTGPDEEKKKHILAYRCKLSIYGSPQQDADPSDGGWYTDASVGCGSSPGTRKWLSSIEVYVYSYPEFP